MIEPIDKMPQWEKDSLLKSYHNDVSRLEQEIDRLKAELTQIRLATLEEVKQKLDWKISCVKEDRIGIPLGSRKVNVTLVILEHLKDWLDQQITEAKV